MHRPHRRTIIAILALAVGAIGGVTVWRQRQQPLPRVAACLEALKRGEYRVVQRQIDAWQNRAQLARHVHLLKGALALELGDHELALSHFSQTPPEGPLRTVVLLLTGEALYRQGELLQAAQLMRTVAAETPEQLDAHRWLGAIYYDLGSMDEAIRELEYVAEHDPTDSRSLRLLGLIHFDFEQDADAAEYYRQALERGLDPDQRTDVLRELATSLIRMRQYSEALDVLSQAPQTGEYLALAAECHWALGDTGHAQALIDQAGGLRTADARVGRIHSRMLLERGEIGQAVAQLEQLVSEDPHDFRSGYQLALAYRRLGRDDDWRSALEKVERSRELYRSLSDLNTQAIERPRDAELRTQIADVCDQLGKPELADVWRRAAAALQQSSETAPEDAASPTGL